MFIGLELGAAPQFEALRATNLDQIVGSFYYSQETTGLTFDMKLLLAM